MKTRQSRTNNRLMLEDDIRDALRKAKAERGLQMFHTANAAIRLGLPLVLSNVQDHLTPSEVLDAVLDRISFGPVHPNKT